MAKTCFASDICVCHCGDAERCWLLCCSLVVPTHWCEIMSVFNALHC